ncbi:efflux transporter outer membrane subunit [Vibrio salinus]|uniref:efflux transporter outer membrane subunit n=1 Tax=Vibrio salinus TaxID=2899784 RepID=UPI001E536368|nr:efflux transporter outer membrane subunit [Vibrio salinus]MCE0495898.1 efflux transporter outer membrane subunit [Vibrio salinus]
MIKLTKISIFVSLSLLYGCSAPDQIKPQNKLNDQAVLSHSSNLKSQQFSVADWPKQDWWKSFGDPQLNQLIERALKNSPDIQLANAMLTKASSYVMAADSQFDPTLTADAAARRARLSRSEDYSMQGNRYGTVYDLGLNGSYTFDLWGGERSAWEASVNNQQAAEVDHQAAKITLSNAIIRSYVELENSYSLLDLAHKDLERTQRIVRITQNLLNHGLTSDDRLYTAQSNAAGAQQVLKKRTLAIRQLKNAIATLVGEGPDTAWGIQRPTSQISTVLKLPEDLPANLLSHRPDIVAAKWRVEAASKNIDAAKTRFYPNVNLSAMAGFKAMLGDAVFEDVSRSWNVTPAISLPIFTKGLTADLIEKTADYDTAVAQYNKSLTNALGQVTDSILAIKSLGNQLKDAEQSMHLADKSYRITEKRYQSGMGSQLEVLIAEDQLIQAESAYTTLKNQQQEEQVLLIQALGGGFSNVQAPAKTVTDKD